MTQLNLKLVNRTLLGLLFVTTISASSISCAKEEKSTATAETVTDVSVKSQVPDTMEDPMTHGEEAHKVHCYKCHTDEIYTRDDRLVKSLDALSQQVDRCKDGTGAPWFEEDAAAVTQFLNKKYYRF